jgi:hypothetical protein
VKDVEIEGRLTLNRPDSLDSPVSVKELKLDVDLREWKVSIRAIYDASYLMCNT